MRFVSPICATRCRVGIELRLGHGRLRKCSQPPRGSTFGTHDVPGTPARSRRLLFRSYGLEKCHAEWFPVGGYAYDAHRLEQCRDLIVREGRSKLTVPKRVPECDLPELEEHQMSMPPCVSRS